MKINFSFSKLLNNNRFIKILSVIIAVIAWFVVAITMDNTREKIIDGIPLTIDTANTSVGTMKLSVIDGAETTVSVKVEGVAYKIGNLSKEDFIAIPKLSTVTAAGEQDVKIEISKADVNDTEFKIVSYTPSVKLNFDRIDTKKMPITAVADNIKAADGYSKEKITPSPNEITLSGPQSQLDLIARCNVEYNNTEVLEDTQTFDGTLAFYDHKGNKLETSQIKNVSYETKNYQLTVPIFQHKTVPVVVTFINVPEGFDTTNLSYSLSADKITVAGPRDIIDKREEVTIGPVDFRKLNIGSVFNLEVSLNAAEANVDGITQIEFSMDASLLDKKQLTVTNILAKNKPAGYEVTLRSESINNVKLVGNKEDIAQVTAKDLIAWVDLKDIDTGSWRAPATIFVTGGYQVWAIGDYEASIVVTEKK